MTNYTLTPKTGNYSLTGYPAALLALGDLKLDPAGPFYPFMLTFLAASAGLTAVYDAGHYADFMQGTDGIFPAPALGAKVNLADCVGHARAGALPQRDAEIRLCAMLMNSAYESLDEATRDRLRGNLVFEVFRHARNAASHGNKWKFRDDQPARAAAWRGLVLDHTQKGNANRLQGQQCIYGSLWPGDLLFLLRDIETLLATP
jgi:hypothetical protein